MAPAAGNSAPLPPYPDRFYAAAQYAAVPGTLEIDPEAEHPPKPFSDLTSLLLYSLYQQASYGPCTTQKPWFLNVVESAKWASWKELGNMAPVEAMRLFVRTLEEEDPEWWVKAQSKPRSAGMAGANGNLEEYDDGAPLSPELPFLPCNQWQLLEVKGRKPAARYQHVSVIMSKRIFFIGGNGNGRFLNDIHVLDLTNLTWSKLETPSPVVFPPCAGHRGVQMDHRTLLVIGGHSHEAAERVTVRAFNIFTRQWSLIKTNGESPVARGGHSITKIGTSLWLFGGEDPRRRLHNDLHVLDIQTWTWRTISTSGEAPSPRSDHSAVVREDRYLTVFGGGSHSICFNDLHELDTETAIWTRIEAGGSIPKSRAGHAGALVGNKWYIVGGGDNLGGSLETMMLDFDSFKWSLVATVPGRTAISSEGLSVVVSGEKEEAILFSFGGYSGRYHNEVNAFQPGEVVEKPKSETPASSEQVQTEAQKKPVDSPNPEGTEAAKSEELTSAETEAKEQERELQRQLEEATEQAAKVERKALDLRADAEYIAAKAKADAWLAIGKVKMEEESLKEKLLATLKAKEQTDSQLEEVRHALTGAHTESSRLRKDLQECRTLLAEAQIRALRVEENAEMVKMQKDYAAAKNILADTEQELLSVRGTLAGEQARCFRLEVEVAELRQRLQGLESLEREVDLLRRQKMASDEAAAAVAAAAAQKSAPGVWGWLAGPAPKPNP